jgi:hypothetical protein
MQKYVPNAATIDQSAQADAGQFHLVFVPANTLSDRSAGTLKMFILVRI